MPKLKGVPGGRYGRLIALSYHSGEGQTKGYWLCRCDCGNECRVTGGNLNSGRQISCGCLRRENSQGPNRKAGRTADQEIGKRYGRLTVIARAESVRRDAYWLCRCSCGNEVTVRANFLRSGRNVSCGCWVPRKTAKHPTGAAHHNWKGEKVGYHALHVWINRKKDKTGFCSICGAERYTEWGNVSEDRSYSRNLGDYIEVCKPCHLDLDGHPWKRSAKLKETQ